MALYTQTGSLQTYNAVEAAGPGVLVPDAQLLFTGEYSRAGSDLVLTGSDGAKFHVTGYFNSDAPPSLVSPDGAKLPGDVVMSLAGPQFPGQYAQAGDAANGKQAIGKVESSSGSASAVRTDGTTVVLKAGDPVFQGDVVLTGPASKLGISFVDGTIFSLSANARMVLNSLVYDPDAGQNNSMLFSLVEGSFVFAAGQIAPTGDMKIQTPVATMGIRGTAPTVNIDSATGEVNFSIVADPDGHVGIYTLYNLDNGLPIGTVSSVGTKWQLTSAKGQIIELEKNDADLLNDANAVGELNTIYTQWQNSTQQNTESPQAGPENNGPPSGGLNTNPQNPDAPGADGNTGNPGSEGEGDGQPPPQGNEQQSGTPPPPPTNTNNDLPPPPPTEASGPTIINGTPQVDLLEGTPGDDIIDGLEDDDTINALDGNDVIIIGPDSGVDTIDGGEGTDTILFEGDLDIDTETFEGEVDNIEIVDLNKTDENTLTISADDINGLNENKILQIRGGTNSDETTDTLNLTSTIFNDQNELVEGSWQQLLGTLKVINGISFDVFQFFETGNEDGVPLATAEVERGIDITLGKTVIGTDESEELQGGEGFDIVNALGGDDTIIGGSGEGDDNYDGGEGNDTISYTSTSQGIVINLVDGTVNGPEIGFDTIVNLQNFVAGSGNDTFIFGEDSGWFFDGGDGIDTVRVAGGLNIDTSDFDSDAENIEIIDLNKTDHNTFTISADDVAGGLNDTLQFRGGGDPGDTLNLVNEFIIDEDEPTEQNIGGSWQQLTGVIRVIDGIIFDVYEFVDGQDNVLATAEVERGIDVNTVDPEFHPPANYAGALGANASASESLPVDGANFNSPEPNLSDYWVFYAIAGQEVTVQVGRDESALDPALWLFNGLIEDPSVFGARLDSGDPGFIDFADDEIQHPGPFGDPTATFIAPTTGFYTAIVTNFASGADDGDGVFPYTIEVSGNADLPGSYPGSNVLSEGFENGFAANGWETINATISSNNSNEGDSSALLTTTTGNEDTTPDFVRTNAQEVANLVGATLAQLDPLGGDPGFATEGSAIANSVYAMEGQIFSFDWFFSTYEYNEANEGIVNDFAFFVIDGEVFKLFDSESVDSQIDELAPEGWNSFSIAVDNSGYHDIAFGVLDNEDTAVESSLNIDNLRLEQGGDVPHLMGGPGNDILVSGQGQNTITTDLGTDKIIFGHINDGIDLITDFGLQDTLDITGLLTVAFDPANPGGFVRATTDGNDTTISVDTDGPGGPAPFDDIAVLQGIGDVTVINVSIGDEDTFVTSAV